MGWLDNLFGINDLAEEVKDLARRAYAQGYAEGESSALADVMALVDGDYDDAEALARVKKMVGLGE